MYVALGLILVLLAAVLVKLVAIARRDDEENDTVAAAMADVAERIAKSSAETRIELGDKVNSQFNKIWERLDGQLARGRTELSNGLNATTQALEKKFLTLEGKTTSQLETIRTKVDERLDSIGKNVQRKLDENMKESFKHFEKFQEYMKAAEQQLQNVGSVGESINDLNNLLKLPHLRGEFGESSLDVLLADFLPSEMYERQVKVGSGIVDFLVKFPSVSIPIDSKFPREQVLPLFEDCNSEKLAEARKKLEQAVKTQANHIAKYVCPEEGTADMVLMFLPSETLYFEVVRNVDLWNTLAAKKVYPVSPNTLAITLKSIYLAYKNYQVAHEVKNTIKSIKLAKKHFDHFENQFGKVGSSLSKAQEAFQTANTHLGRYSSSIYRLTGAEPDAIGETCEEGGEEDDDS